MGGKSLQPAFTRGELSPALYARVDLALYQSALKTCRNFIPRPYGGIENRPGTQYIGEVKDSSAACRLIDFRFSASQNYVLEFGNQYIRFYRDGALLTSGGSAVEVETPYTTDELSEIRYVQSADVMTLVHPNHKPRELRRNSDTSWELAAFDYKNGPFKALNTDECCVVWATAATGTVTINASSDVFSADDVGALFYMEARNLAEIKPWEPNKQIAYDGANPNGEKRRNSEGNVYQCVTDQAATAGNEIRTGNIEPTHTNGIASDGDGNQIRAGSTLYTERAGVEWEYLHSNFGIVLITGYTSATEVTASVIKRLPDAVVSSSSLANLATFSGDGSTTVFSIPGATSSDSTDYRVTITTTVNYAEPGVPTATSSRVMASDEYSIDATADEITFDVAPASGTDGTTGDVTSTSVTVQEFTGANNTDVWALGAWSEAEGWPSVVTYFADRLVFANTSGQPQTVWMSKTGIYDDFGTSTPLVDDDAITFTINSRQVNAIRELVPLADLVIMTAGGEWRMVSDGVVAPATIALKPQSYRGVRNQRAEVIGNKALYVQAQGSAVRDISYAFSEDGYIGADLTLSADHLFRGRTIDEIDFQQVPYSVLWSVRDDGRLLSLTYIPEEQVIGWARHDTDGDEFESVCVIPEGDEDVPYFIVKRTIGGATKRYVERLNTRLFDTAADAFFVDSGLTYDGENTSAATMTLSGSTWDANSALTLTASTAQFTSASIGDEVELVSGDDSVRVSIVGYTSTTVVSVVSLADVPSALQATATSSWTYRADTVSGLDHLEGRTVAVLNDGNEEDQKTVSSGSISLDNPGGKVHVGLPIEADAGMLDVVIWQGEMVADRKKMVSQVSLFVRESRAIWAGTKEVEEGTGTSDESLYEYKQRENEDYDDATTATTGVITIPTKSTWGEKGSVFIRQVSPLPLTILGVIPEMDIAR